MFKKVQLPFYLFYVGGFVYTAFIVSSNLEEYFAHKSNDVHMELDETNETCSQVINDINKESHWFKAKHGSFTKHRDLYRLDALKTQSG